MSISITPRAAKRIEEIRESQQIAANVPLRVSVESGGCSGLTYKLDFDVTGYADGADARGVAEKIYNENDSPQEQVRAAFGLAK